MLTDKQKELQNIDLSQYSPRERASIRLYGLKNKDWDSIDAANHYHTWLHEPTEVEISMTTFEEAKKWCHDNIYMHEFYPVPDTRGDINSGSSYYKAKHPENNWGTISFKHPQDAFIFKLRYS